MTEVRHGREQSRCLHRAGHVEVETIDYPKLELQDGPGVNPANVGRKVPHGVILKVVATNICGCDQHMVRGPHDRPGGPGARPRDHRRGHRGRAGRGVHQGRRPVLSAPFNIACGRCRNCKERQDRHLPERQPRPSRLGLRLCRHGRLGRRPGRVRDGSLRRLQPAEVPRQGPGHGEDPRPDDAVRHLPHRLPRRGHRRRDHRVDGLCRRRRPGRAGRAPTPRSCSAPPWSSSAT